MITPRACPIFVSAFLLTINVLSAGAAMPNIAPLDSRLTIQVTEAPLGQFLDTLSAQTKADFILTGETDKIRVTTDVKDKKASEALQSILESKGLVYRRIAKSNTYVIASKSEDVLMRASERASDAVLNKNRALDSRVTIAVTNAPLKTFLETVTAQTKVNFTLAPELDKIHVTLDLKKVTAREALELILELKDLEIAQNGKNDFAIKPRPNGVHP